jgi:hypothetical protein
LHKDEKIRDFFWKETYNYLESENKLKKEIHIPFLSPTSSVAKYKNGGPSDPPSSSCCNECYKKINTRGGITTPHLPLVAALAMLQNKHMGPSWIPCFFMLQQML